MYRKALGLLFAILLTGGATLWASDNQVLAEVRFVAHNGDEKKAGVWVDGQYLGYVKELNGDKKMLLLPGKHEIVVRQAWYRDYVEQALLEPGEIHMIKLAMAKQSSAGAAAATSELKIDATPPRAAVFVDEQFAGHVDEFDGAGKAMLLTPGQHRVRIALPGYLPFDTTVDLRPHQKLKIQTELERGSIAEAGSLVSKD
ncbi:MAG TPA: PEGA domain-containing protein [Terriglobales bacterium]|nr:PEGA domain-containing protein [Terriglobales bacterium]